jgi:[acyl-carrier-protein] S-malonyltransferase
LNYEAVLDLADRRASAMDAATTQRSGLVAIRGLDRGATDAICRTHGTHVAIVNGRDQMLIGSISETLAAVAHNAQVHGAKRTTMPAVAVPSHTPLQADAGDRLRHALTKALLPGEMPSGVRVPSGIAGTHLLT